MPRRRKPARRAAVHERLVSHTGPTAMLPDAPALFTDLYQLTMLRAYRREGLTEEAVFSLFVRRLRDRNYLVACGLEDVLDYLEGVRFTEDDLAYLATLGHFDDAFLSGLESFRFTGDVYAMPEGTPFFAEEPVLEVVAPIDEAQLVETFLLNAVTFASAAASKWSRVVRAAAGRPVIEFGTRRTHGLDAALTAARAAYVVGAAGTSNVLAGRRHGIPVSGTMAHAYIEAHDDEAAAFAAFAELYPGTTLLVDTYDTGRGVERVAALVAGGADVGTIRLDSGDLGALAHDARRRLDEGGAPGVRIFASGSLDEHAIAALVAEGAPIDGFGVGTRVGTVADRPYLDTVYKLARYAGQDRMKLSANKQSLPGRKQVYRLFEDGRAVRDVIAAAEEEHPGTPLLAPVLRGGRRVAPAPALGDVRDYAAEALGALPAHLHALTPADPPYPVEASDALRARTGRLRAALESGR